MNINCINVHGRIEHQLDRMEIDTHHDRDLEMNWGNENAKDERWEYCNFVCPVRERCKFYARYGK